MTSGITNVFLNDRFGFGIVRELTHSINVAEEPALAQAAPFGAVMQTLGFTLMCWGGPYPLFVIAYLINGFGLGLQVGFAYLPCPRKSSPLPMESFSLGSAKNLL